MTTTFFVDGPGGDGLAAGGTDFQLEGTLENPFATIRRAVTFAQPGDTIAIRGGVYRQEVDLIRSGTEELPITIRAYDSEEVVITTTEELSGFTRFDGDIFRATLEGSTTNSILNRHELAVFVDGQLINENQSNNNSDFLRSTTYDTVDAGTTATTIVDAALIGRFNDTPDALDGSFVRVLTSGFTIETRRVTDFDSSTGTLTLATPLSRAPDVGNNYLIHDALALLDAPNEYYFEEETNSFFLQLPGGIDPDNVTVEVTRRREAFDLNGHDYIHFVGLTLQGGDFQLPSSDGLVIDSVNIIAPDRFFGPDFPRPVGQFGALRTLELNGRDNIIRNSEFSYVFDSPIVLRGDNNQIVNNFFHDIVFSGNGSAVTINGADGNLISHNTITRSGRAAIQFFASGQNLIQNNDFSQTALTTFDVGAIGAFNASFGNSVIRENVFHDIDAPFSSGFYADNFTSDVIVHNNITFGVEFQGGQVNLPSNFILLYNNTFFDSGQIGTFDVGDTSSFGNRFVNNLFSSIDPRLLAEPDPFLFSSNLQSSSAANFINAANEDFRLRSTSAAVDAGEIIPGITNGFSGSTPDIGALELGEDIFEFGHNFAAPPSPVFDLEGRIFGTNAVVNPGFEDGLTGFTITAGAPRTIFANASNFRDAALGRLGRRALELTPGESVSQTITGLTPNTLYTVGGTARNVGRIIQAEDFNSASNTTVTRHREENAIGQLNANDFLSFNNIDFGSETPLYDQIQLFFARSGTGGTVELRLDSVDGTLIGTADIVPNTEIYTSAIADNLSAVTGTHNLFVVVRGQSGQIGLLDSLRFFDTNSSDQGVLEVSGFDGDATASLSLGGMQFPDATPTITFRTGPNATSAVISVINPAGLTSNLYADALSLTEAPVASPALPGDLNLDEVVSAADYTVWRDTLGTSTGQFSGADANGSTVVDSADYEIFAANFGNTRGLFTAVDDTMGNGGLQTTTTANSPGQATTNLASGLVTNDTGRALIVSGSTGAFVEIPGWRATRVSTVGANVAFGFDGTPENIVGTEPAQYAFVNSGEVVLTSDDVLGDFPAGSTFDLSFLAEATTGPGEVTATLTFDSGESHTFNTLANLGTTAIPFSDSYTLQSGASSVSISLLLAANDTSLSGAPQTKVDSIALDVTAAGNPFAAAVASLATTETVAAVQPFDPTSAATDTAGNSPAAVVAPFLESYVDVYAVLSGLSAGREATDATPSSPPTSARDDAFVELLLANAFGGSIDQDDYDDIVGDRNEAPGARQSDVEAQADSLPASVSSGLDISLVIDS